MKVVRLLATRIGRLNPRRNVAITYFFQRFGRLQSRGAAGRIMSIKNSIGNLTRVT